MRTRSAVRNGVEFGVAVAILKLLEWSPAPFANHLARTCTWLLDRSLPRLRKVGLENLAWSLPTLTRAQHTAVIDGVFRSIARVLVTFAKFPHIHPNTAKQWIRIEGREHVDQALRQGRGVLFATAHFGNWELSAYAWALLAAPMHVVVRPLDNAAIDKLVETRREMSGNRIIGKEKYARSILRALAANQAVGILVDQNSAADSGVFVDFFGRKACADAGFARLAARSGAAVIPGFALWEESERRYVLRFFPPIPITGDVQRDTQSIQSHLEEVIRRYPDQWLWIHRRWKTQP